MAQTKCCQMISKGTYTQRKAGKKCPGYLRLSVISSNQTCEMLLKKQLNTVYVALRDKPERTVFIAQTVSNIEDFRVNRQLYYGIFFFS